MKTSRNTTSGQQTGARAPVRSTSARARSTPAKPLSPSDDFAPLFAGLVALCQAHEGARSAPARALLAALAAILDLCRRYLAAPGAWRLASIDAPAAGLSLVPVEGAPRPAAPAAPPARPRLNPAHLALVIGLEEALLRLAEAQQAAAGLARGTSRERPTAQLDFALEQLADALCGCAAEVTAAPVGLTPMAHVIALNDLANAADPGDPEACAELARLDVRAAASHFNRSSND